MKNPCPGELREPRGWLACEFFSRVSFCPCAQPASDSRYDPPPLKDPSLLFNSRSEILPLTSGKKLFFKLALRKLLCNAALCLDSESPRRLRLEGGDPNTNPLPTSTPITSTTADPSPARFRLGPLRRRKEHADDGSTRSRPPLSEQRISYEGTWTVTDGRGEFST